MGCLTVTGIRGARADGGVIRLYDGDGLVLQVGRGKDGTVTRYSILAVSVFQPCRRQRAPMGLGKVTMGDVAKSLATARKLAADATLLMRKTHHARSLRRRGASAIGGGIGPVSHPDCRAAPTAPFDGERCAFADAKSTRCVPLGQEPGYTVSVLCKWSGRRQFGHGALHRPTNAIHARRLAKPERSDMGNERNGSRCILRTCLGPCISIRPMHCRLDWARDRSRPRWRGRARSCGR